MKGTSQQYSEGAEKSQLIQKDKVLDSAQNPATHRRRVFFCYFTCYQSQKKHSWDSLASACPLVPRVCGWEMKNRVPATDPDLCDGHSPRFGLGKDLLVAVAEQRQQR